MLRYEIDYSDEYEDEDYDEDEDENEDENSTPQSDYELFCISIATCKNPEEIDALIEEKTEDKKAVEATLNSLNELKNGAKHSLEDQFEDEKTKLCNMRISRNDHYGHDVGGDEDYISDIGTCEPDAGELYVWSKTILDYIKAIGKRGHKPSVYVHFLCNELS